MRRVALILAFVVTATGPVTAARLAPGATEVSSDARPLPFLSDDYARALAEARALSRPLFIEAWAPW